MTLSRWRRIATGIAAGVIVLCAALLGASFRSDTSGVSVASELRPSVIIPIEEDPIADDDAASVETTDETADEPTDETAEAAPDDADPADVVDTPDEASADEGESLSESVTVIETDDLPAEDASADETAADDTTADDTTDADTEDSSDTETAPTDDTDSQPAESEAPAAPATPAAPLTSGDDSLGTGGGVDDAECALDRLVIYAGARVGGVAGRIRAALNQAGFAAGCPTPVTVLASNCPLQFAGVLGAGSGYDPSKSFVASSSNVDRETMTAVMGTVGFTGSQIDILDFGFVNADRPGEQWMAIFVPPSFAGWENLATRAGLPITSQSLCSASGQLAG